MTGGEGHRDALYAGGLSIAAAVFYVASWPWLYIPAFLALAALTWRRLDLGLLVVPLFVPYYMAPKHFGTLVFAPSEIFVLLDCLVAAGYVVTDRTRLRWSRLRSSPFLWPAVLLLVAATISTVLAVDRHHALEWYRWVVLEPLAFFALLLLAGTRRTWPWLFAALVIAGLVSGLIGLWQYLTHTDLTAVPGTSVRRIHALYGSPDNLGLLYDRVLPVWFAVAIAPPAAWRRVLWVLVGAVMVAALILTYSRGAWAGVGIGCLAVLALRFRWGRWLLLAALLVGAAGLAVKGSRLVDIFRSAQTPTAQVRIDVWKSSIQMVRDHPVFGVGPDNFVHYYAPTRKEDLYQRECAPGLGYMQPGAGSEPCLSHPHDEILDFWLSTGLLGLAAFAWLEVVFWRQALAAWQQVARAAGGAGRSALLVGSMGAMVASLIHGLIDNSYFLIDLAIIFWLLCAYISSLRAHEMVDPRG